MADARRRRFDVVLCVRLDRMGRSLPHLISILQELGRFGVAFTSVAENIDLTTPAGKLVANFLAAIAEFERHLIRERVLAGLRRAKSTGVRLGRPRRGFDVNEALNFKRSGLSWKELARKVSVPVATLRRTLGPLLKNPDAQSA
jgi:DNA invertase Pin-like site-specific DNA recombinase